MPSEAPEPASRPVRRRAGKATYPRFEIVGDTLVKTGWSKKKRTEYTHKAPMAVLDAVRQRVERATEEKKVFTVEDVTPVPAPDGAGEVPMYQVYLCMKYLVSEGHLSKMGRDGYGNTPDGAPSGLRLP